MTSADVAWINRMRETVFFFWLIFLQVKTKLTIFIVYGRLIRYYITIRPAYYALIFVLQTNYILIISHYIVLYSIQGDTLNLLRIHFFSFLLFVFQKNYCVVWLYYYCLCKIRYYSLFLIRFPICFI